MHQLQPIQLTFRGVLRDYQQEAIERATKRDLGVISLAKGSGKTVIALAMIAEQKQSCLILVHTKDCTVSNGLGVIPMSKPEPQHYLEKPGKARNEQKWNRKRKKRKSKKSKR